MNTGLKLESGIGQYLKTLGPGFALYFCSRLAAP